MKATADVRVSVRRSVVPISIPQTTVQVIAPVTTNQQHTRTRIRVRTKNNLQQSHIKSPTEIIKEKLKKYNSITFQLIFMGVDHPHPPLYWCEKKATADARVSVRRSVVPISKPQTTAQVIAPVTTNQQHTRTRIRVRIVWYIGTVGSSCKFR